MVDFVESSGNSVMFRIFLSCFVFLQVNAIQNRKALNKILTSENPDTVQNRELVREILTKANQHRSQRLQYRRPSSSKSKKPQFNNGPKNNNSRHTPFEIINKDIEEYTFQSDIMLNEKQARVISNHMENDSNRVKRQAIVSGTNFWDIDTPIYYEFDKKLSELNIANVQKAIDFWNEHSCLSFKENSTAKSRLFLTSAGGCWSYVGRQSSYPYQVVSVGPGCDSLGTAAHELAHAIGFWHQQSRFDRDDYVNIDYSNIQPRMHYNFAKMSENDAQTLGMPYDYGSVMQYSEYAFAIDYNKVTISTKNPEDQNTLGQRDAPAFSDIRNVNTLYNCSAKRCSSKIECSNNGIQDSKNCDQCICPPYFSGPTCLEIPTGNLENCNGQTLEANTEWKNFTGIAGDPSSYTLKSDKGANCIWHIKASSDQKIEFRITKALMDAVCMEHCPWQSLDINIGKFDVYGMIMCCDTFVNHTFISEKNLIAIRAKVLYNQLNFGIEYRILPLSSNVTIEQKSC